MPSDRSSPDHRERGKSTIGVAGEEVGRLQSAISIGLDPKAVSEEVTEINASRIRRNDETIRTHLLFQSIKKRGRAEIELCTITMVAEHHASVVSENRAKARAIARRESLRRVREYGSKRRTRLLARGDQIRLVRSGQYTVWIPTGLSARFTQIEPQ